MISTDTRRLEPSATRTLSIQVTDALYGRLVEMSRAQNMTPSLYGKVLLEAAYSARCKPTGDRALDAAVARIGVTAKGARDTDAALARQIEIITASLTDAEGDARDLRQRLAEIEADRAVDQGNLRDLRVKFQALEKDNATLALKLEQARDLGLAYSADAKAAQAEVASLREAVQDRDDAADVIEPEPAPSAAAPLSAVMRQARAYASAGWTIAEIARELRQTRDDVATMIGRRTA